MAKRIALPTRAFGAEPGMPDRGALAEWVAEHRGRVADLTTFRLDRSLAPQAEAGIGLPCAGGRFYGSRITGSCGGVSSKRVEDELHIGTADIAEDAAGIVLRRKGAWCAMPAPLSLGLTDAYYGDRAEWIDAVSGICRTAMRAMRDFGVAGHVLICESMDSAEIAALAWQKVFFFQPGLPSRRDFEALLEYQQDIAAGKDSLDLLFDLAGEYTIRRLCLLDPDRESVSKALSCLDPDQISCGGYCTEPDGTDYWKDLVAAAGYER